MRTCSNTAQNAPRFVVAAALAFGLLAVASPAAQAGLPGANGAIAYASKGTALTTPNDDIYVTDEAGSPPRRLTTDPGLDRAPAVSPDGTRIAFWSDRLTGEPEGRNRDSELYLMDIADEDGDGSGDHLRQLTFNGARDFAPAWSPNAKRIAFASDRDGNTEIYVLRLSDLNTKRLTDDGMPDDDRPKYNDQAPVFSPDGETVAFQTNRGVNLNQEIFTIALEDDPATDNVDEEGQLSNLTNNVAQDSLPDYAPDGTHLTFTSIRDGTDRDIWAMGANGSAPYNLTPTSLLQDAWSSWSPDGTRIAYGSGSGPGFPSGPDAEIYTIAPDGQSPRKISTPELLGEAEVDWGPSPASAKG